MIKLSDYWSYIPPIITLFEEPWPIPAQLPSMIFNEYIINNGNALHRTATIESGAILISLDQIA